VGWIALLLQLPIQLFLAFWADGFFGSLSSSLPIFARGSWVPFLFFGGIAFFSIPAVAYFGKKLNYSRTEYRFFGDRLEFQEGFFSINKKVIEYRDVKEVTLRKGIFQRIYGLGTIYLATLATGSSGASNPFVALGFGNVSASGVYVRDIKEPDRMFDEIRQSIDRSKK
jgi:uncharacterized membrane protein YdbT with pleckstrin-like domain